MKDKKYTFILIIITFFLIILTIADIYVEYKFEKIVPVVKGR
jgi:uncharacterized Rmd1/YagE family protein